jgi:FkbM family methyltransferase
MAVHHWNGSWLPDRAAPVPGNQKPFTALRQRTRQIAAQSLHRYAYPMLRGVVQQVRPPPEGGNHACYLGGNRVLITTTQGFSLYAFADDRSLTPELAAHGAYDRPFLGFLARTLRPGDRFIDVGANIGLFAIAAARLVGPMGHVLAYEPDPETADLLEDSAGMNWLAPRVQVLRSAAGETGGPVMFARHPTYRANSSARTSFGEDGSPLHDVPPLELQTFEVPCERVETRVPAGVPIRLVKIDVEGGEAAVIGGLEGLFSRRAIDYLSVECIRDHAGERWPDLIRKLRTLRDVHGGELNAIGSDGALEVISLDKVASAERWSHVVIDFTE